MLAIDPTSPFSGGAILADRVRMLDHSGDPGVYIRSMASRGSLGGLAPTAADALTVLEAARFEAILIETVGVGQAEVDVAGLADRVVLVLTPGGGDDMQAMKAGVMEIADVYAINKADLPGADAVERTLRGLLALAPDHAARSIVHTSAKDGSGVGELLERLRAAEPDPERAVQYWRRRLADALARGVAEQWVPRLASEQAIAEAAARVAARECNPYEWVRALLQTPTRG
ncbi:MAG: methylmalonyl Co-A mutase-associated GTPase MeaB [Bryobacterales bacterium]